MNTFKEKIYQPFLFDSLNSDSRKLLLRESEQIFSDITICILLKELTTVLSALYTSGGEEQLIIPYLNQTHLSGPTFV